MTTRSTILGRLEIRICNAQVAWILLVSHQLISIAISHEILIDSPSIIGCFFPKSQISYKWRGGSRRKGISPLGKPPLPPLNPNHLLHQSHLSSESKAWRIEELGGSRGACKEELRYNLGIGVFYFSYYYLNFTCMNFLFSIMDVIVFAPMRG